MDKYIVVDEEHSALHTAILCGNMKKTKIYVGDIVTIIQSYDTFVINGLIKRKNMVIRPPVANIDQMILCVSIDMPKPDYTLLDKQLVLCISKNIIPVICISKVDLLNDELKIELEYIKTAYRFFKIVEISSNKNIGLDKLRDVLKNKTSAFSGNSGVGKSSVITKLLGENLFNIEVGALTAKINRGKHTTKYVKIYSLETGTYILDTPGFSSYELFDIEYKELKNYYPEFKDIVCKYQDCSHTNEGLQECNVKLAASKGAIDKDRYARYNEIYTILKQKDNIKYKK